MQTWAHGKRGRTISLFSWKKNRTRLTGGFGPGARETGCFEAVLDLSPHLSACKSGIWKTGYRILNSHSGGIRSVLTVPYAATAPGNISKEAAWLTMERSMPPGERLVWFSYCVFSTKSDKIWAQLGRSTFFLAPFDPFFHAPMSAKCAY